MPVAECVERQVDQRQAGLDRDHQAHLRGQLQPVGGREATLVEKARDLPAQSGEIVVAAAVEQAHGGDGLAPFIVGDCRGCAGHAALEPAEHGGAVAPLT